MSVHALAPSATITLDAAAADVVIAFMAASTVSFLAAPFLTAVLIAPVPIGFVKMRTSPGCEPAFVITL